MRALTTAGRETAHIDLALAELADAETLTLEADGRERAAVVLSGTVEVTADTTELGLAGGRDGVFEGPGHTVYAPAGVALTLTAAHGSAQLAIAAAPAPEHAAAARIIGPAQQRVNEVGEGNWHRTVRTILGPEHAAGRLLLGETINPPGNWSSYPPHRHDRHDPPREAELEEVYMFRVDPPGGFGVQIRYDEAGHEEAFLVRDDDVAAIRSGFHPVVAASGYTLYYLWVLAGEGREMMPFMDPAHEWVQNRS